jgi:hypothetical protein
MYKLYMHALPVATVPDCQDETACHSQSCLGNKFNKTSV